MHVIDEKLQSLECPLSSFTPLVAGVVGRTRLTQFLKGSVQLDSGVVNELIGVLNEMIELKLASVIAPNWQDTENIREQLRRRREIKLAFRYDESVLEELLQEKNGAGN